MKHSRIRGIMDVLSRRALKRVLPLWWLTWGQLETEMEVEPLREDDDLK